MALINCWECNERISEHAKKCPHCGASPDDEPTDVRVWLSLIIGFVAFFIIESNFDINGFWNHILLFVFLCLGFPIGTIMYLSFKVSDEDKKMMINPFAEAKANPNASPFAIVIDTETTGLVKYEGMPTKKAVQENPNLFPDIVEIAWITVSRKYEEITRKTFIIKQERKIPKRAVEIHGITDEKCQKEGVEWEEVYSKLTKDLEDCEYIVGHNISFDKKVIEAFSLKKGLKKPFTKMKKYDTMQMGRKIMTRKYFKLKDLAFKLFTKKQIESNFTFHNAMDDVEITTNCFCWLHHNNMKY